MKIRLESIQLAGAGVLVHFTSAVGEAAALWQSTKITPAKGHEYDVELDIDAILKLGENASVQLGAKPGLAMIGTKVQIVGIVESIDDDGMVYFRLAPDCIMMIESFGSTFHKAEVLRLALEPVAIRLTPIG
jgi:hypothetical protein